METYNGHVRTPADAIILFEACRLGLLPRVQRRLSEKERQSIKSGSVFVWDEREAGMRRWTDGKSWSASRVSGSFLTYREMEGKRGGNGFVPPLAAPRAGKTPESTRGSDSDLDMPQEDGPDGYRYKPDGLMKQSFSITTSNGNHLHLISYYSRSSPTAQNLNNPTSDPALRHIRPQKGMYPESTVHEQQSIPAVTRAPMVGAPYSTVPHMAGYARGPPPPPAQGPPQHYAPAGYGWTQPPNVAPYPAYGYHYGAPTMPSNGHSPLAYSQSALVPPSHSTVSPHYGQSPPSRSEPHHSLAHHRSSSSSNGMPQYSQIPPQYPGQYPPQHHSQHPPQHYPQHRPQHPTQPSQQPPQQVSSHSSQPPPQHAQQQAIQAGVRPPSSTPPSTKIDPRLMVPSSLQHQSSHVSSHSRSPSPMAPRQESSNSTPPQTTGASSIPSIGSLVNGSNGTQNAEAPSDPTNRRSASRSPGGTKKSEGPKDIPGDKMGFVEDKRALRVLDRAFRT
ncbi:MAG: hypothetical protein LQ346_006812 [Caloplaca aetnensis]|nr:MAG: hypothetical protein LQ346_006812 [Caloplaca aetnensis]